jgi:hypothetical protein
MVPVMRLRMRLLMRLRLAAGDDCDAIYIAIVN